LFCRRLKLEPDVGSINTEEAARRLARVILSDIELYNRERPKPGETLEGQIEEGRRLFASRVTPDLLPVFGLVLSDRALGGVKTPAAPPSIAARTLEDQPTPAPALAARPPVHQPALAARVPPTPPARETPAVLAQARPAAPPAHEIPIPVLTARFSVPRLLAIVSVVAATVAVLRHLFS
jgi:hypothetical protein